MMGSIAYHLTRAAPWREESGQILSCGWAPITDIHDQDNHILTRPCAARKSLPPPAPCRQHRPRDQQPAHLRHQRLYLALQDPSLQPHHPRIPCPRRSGNSHRAAHVRYPHPALPQADQPAHAVDLGRADETPRSPTTRAASRPSPSPSSGEYQTTRKLSCRAERLRQAFAHILSNSLRRHAPEAAACACASR